jgi:MFS family permease
MGLIVVSVPPIGRDGFAANEFTRRDSHAMGRPALLAVVALSVTQIIGWGSLLFMPAVLTRFMQADLGMSPELAFGGVAAMYLVGALAAPVAGRLIDRCGARWVMAAGSLAAAIGLAWLAHAQGPVSYLAAWCLLGVTCASALTNAACAAVAQAAGSATLRGVTALMFVTGLAGTLSLPAVHILNSAFGWRGACLALAVLNLAVCLPLHLGALRRAIAPCVSRPFEAGPADGWEWPRQHAAFPILSFALGLNVFVTAGFSVHLVGLLRTAGFSDPMAVSLASLVGLAQLAARAVQFMAGRYWLPTSFALMGGLLLPVAMAVMLLPLAASARIDAVIATVFVLLLGLSNGLMMVARTAVPVQIFGIAQYGMWTGKLAAFQNAAAAITPVAFAAALGRGGAIAALLLAAIAALLSLGALIIMTRRNAATAPVA